MLSACTSVVASLVSAVIGMLASMKPSKKKMIAITTPFILNPFEVKANLCFKVSLSLESETILKPKSVYKRVTFIYLFFYSSIRGIESENASIDFHNSIVRGMCECC